MGQVVHVGVVPQPATAPQADLQGLRSARLIEWASTINTLEPGDVISCGVNHQGLGPIQDGETVVMEIEQVGRLSVRIQDPHKRKWPKGIDHEMAAWVKQSIAGERPPLPSVLRGRKGYG